MKNINEIGRYRLPITTTPEELRCRWSKLLNFGDKVLLAGYYYNGPDMPSYFGAVYEFLTDDHTDQGTIELKEVSEVVFEDNGHAIAWGLRI